MLKHARRNLCRKINLCSRVNLRQQVWRIRRRFRTAAAMTVRHLLNQTSGLPTMAGELVLAEDDSPDALERGVRGLATVKVTHPVGSTFQYCNLNYNILGLIVEVVSGESYAHYVRSVVAAAQRAGVPYKVKPATLGTGSDAGPFSRAGLKATTLLPFKWPQQQVAFYHQVWDTPDVLTIEPLLNVLKLSLEWVRVGGEESDRPQ